MAGLFYNGERFFCNLGVAFFIDKRLLIITLYTIFIEKGYPVPGRVRGRDLVQHAIMGKLMYGIS